MDPVLHYLTLPLRYTQHLGGLRWSTEENAVVYPDEGIFSFHEEIALFLDGFAQSHRLIHFGYILHLLDLFRHTRRTITPELDRLRKLFYTNGAFLRNAGAFFGMVCRELPGVAQPANVASICNRLRDPAMPLRWFAALEHSAAEVPPLPFDVFERRVLDRLTSFTEEEIAHWFHDGCGPQGMQGEQLIERMPEPPPRTLGGVVEMLLEQPRLTGAVPYVAQMVSALTLPPRRLNPTSLPIGGYTDVTTHGRPDQLLLSQFALDDWDFFRRFAEKELLYFRREEPQSSLKEELIVVLDQGVRTWGEVRLMLSAAALALAKLAQRRKLVFHLATTGNHGKLVDLLTTEEDELKELVQASDFTSHPGLALETVLESVGWATPTADEQTEDTARDIVLLTHPRCLLEADVTTAARRAIENTRLFSLAVDADGQATWCQWKHGGPTDRRTFLVDRSQPASVTPPQPEPEPGEQLPPWTGDVEPIGFPFRFGVGQPLASHLIEFDHSGEWLLTVARHAMLYLWNVDGQRREILPRPYLDGLLRLDLHCVVGVAGGFVLLCRGEKNWIAFHYDLVRRYCRGYRSEVKVVGRLHWWYAAAHHTVVFTDFIPGCAIDLTLGVQYPPPGDFTGRAAEAFAAAQNGELPVPRLTVARKTDDRNLFFSLNWNPTTGELNVQPDKGSQPWPEFIPLRDGQPLYRNVAIQEAQLGANTLAVKSGSPYAHKLQLFAGPEGRLLREHDLNSPYHGFVLSSNGRHVAMQSQRCVVAVHGVGETGTPRLETRSGGYPQNVQIALGQNRITILTGKKHGHIVDWSGEQLWCKHVVNYPLPPQQPRYSRVLSLHYDPKRFNGGQYHLQGLTARTDCYGHVLLFDREDKLLCVFFSFRATIAGWMPDGTRFGPRSLLGGPPTPGWERKFAQVLREASERGSR